LELWTSSHRPWSVFLEKEGFFFFYIFLILSFTKQVMLRHYDFILLLESDIVYILISREPLTQFDWLYEILLSKFDQSTQLTPGTSRYPKVSGFRHPNTSVLPKSYKLTECYWFLMTVAYLPSRNSLRFILCKFNHHFKEIQKS